MKDKMKYIFIGLAVIIIIITIIGINSFGFFEYVKKSISQNIIKTSNIVVELDDKKSLSLLNDNAYPLSDETGRSLTPYNFTVKNLAAPANFKLKIINDDKIIEKENCKANLMPEQAIHYQLIRDGKVVSENLFSNLTERVIDSGTINSNTSYKYELRIWIDKDAGIEVMNKHFHGKIQVEIL